jgi:hypothetical protein
MPIKIEQVTRKGLVVNDYDTKLANIASSLPFHFSLCGFHPF